MAENSNIQWTDSTWNVARGCSKVNDDCKFCYMMRDGEKYGYDGKMVQKTKTVFNLPLKYKKAKSEVWKGRPLLFTSSLTDFFHKDIDSFRQEAWDIIRKCPHLIFQILTKRPERIIECLPPDWKDGWENVWLGVSAGSQPNYDKMIYAFNNVPSKIKFLSAEPLHGEIVLHGSRDEWDFWNLIFDWIIIGGESGNQSGNYRYRPCDLKWIEQILEQCQNNNIPVFIKQLGTHLAKELKLSDRHGGDILEFPSSLQIRQFPEFK